MLCWPIGGVSGRFNKICHVCILPHSITWLIWLRWNSVFVNKDTISMSIKGQYILWLFPSLWTIHRSPTPFIILPFFHDRFLVSLKQRLTHNGSWTVNTWHKRVDLYKRAMHCCCSPIQVRPDIVYSFEWHVFSRSQLLLLLIVSLPKLVLLLYTHCITTSTFRAL